MDGHGSSFHPYSWLTWQLLLLTAFQFCDLQAFFFWFWENSLTKKAWITLQKHRYLFWTTVTPRVPFSFKMPFSQQWLNSEQQHQLASEVFLFAERILFSQHTRDKLVHRTAWKDAVIWLQIIFIQSIYQPTIQPSSGNHHLRLNYTTAWKPWRRRGRHPPPQCEGRVPPKNSNHASREHSP